jgi:hypothetical protein
MLVGFGLVGVLILIKSSGDSYSKQQAASSKQKDRGTHGDMCTKGSTQRGAQLGGAGGWHVRAPSEPTGHGQYLEWDICRRI